jgi:predicted negative regulator of RcsB-dependent stress response
MAESHGDQEQLEAFKKWWDENGRSIIAGVVIGALGLFGWRGWQSYTQTMAERASTQYFQMRALVEQGNRAQADVAAAVLKDDYRRSPYAALASLSAAKLAVDAGALDDAATHLRWAMEHGKQNTVRQLARLRLARILIAQDKANEALSMLDGESIAVAFATLADEARGDAYVALGRIDEARQAYDRALAATDGDAEFLRLKRADLGQP